MRCLLILVAFLSSSAAHAGCRGGVCELAIGVLKNKEFQHPVLTATRSLVLGEAVVLKTEEAFASVVSHGEFMFVGKHATLGNIYQRGILQLQKPADVRGKIYARVPSQDAKDLLTVGFRHPDIEAARLTSAIELPRNILGSTIDIDGKRSVMLGEGRYGNVSVRHGKLQLKSGVYFFDRLNVGVEGEIGIDNREGTVFVFVLDELRFGGQMHYQAAQSDLVLGYFGRKPVAIAGKLDAYLVAPEAAVSLQPAPKEQAHHLSIFAESIEVAPGTQVVRAIPTYKGDAFRKVANRDQSRDEDAVEEAAPDPEYLRDLADMPNGELILAALDNLRFTNADEQLEYQNALELLRRNPEATVATFEKLNAEIPDKVDSIEVRENLVLVLAELRLDQATHLLAELGTRPVNREILASASGHHDSTATREYSLRGLAFNGLRRLATNGNAEAEAVLLDTAVAGTDELIRDSAAVSYLLSGDLEEQRAQLRRLLPASHQHLANITFDVEPLSKQLESISKNKDKRGEQ